MAVREHHTAAFSAKAARSNTHTSLKKVKGGLSKCEYCIGNHCSENCWTKYLYKKQEFNNQQNISKGKIPKGASSLSSISEGKVIICLAILLAVNEVLEHYLLFIVLLLADSWILDIGANAYMCNNWSLFFIFILCREQVVGAVGLFYG